MAELNANLWWIPPIGSSNLWSNSTQGKMNINKPDVAMFDNAPSDVTAWSFFGKILLWAVVWICVAALLFGVLAAIWWMSWTNDGQVSPILWILLPIVWFIVSFVWNLALAGLYSIFFSKRYYNFGKMCGLIFTSSLIIFVFFFIVYFLFDKIPELYTVLWFQIIFWLYIALNMMDFLSQPNYSAASLMWNTLWCVLSVVAFLWIVSMLVKTDWWTKDPSEMILPITISSIVSYAIMTLGAGIWDAIYYKFYEWWNNPFYLPSLNELREERRKEEVKKAKEEEEVNVEIK